MKRIMKLVLSVLICGTVMLSGISAVVPASAITLREGAEAAAASAEKTIREYIAHLCENREKSFANARTMKNLSRAIFDITMLRLSTCGNPGTDKIVSSEDVESFVWKNMEKKIGY